MPFEPCTLGRNQDGDPAEAALAVVRPMVERRRADLVPVMHPPVLVVPDVFNDADCKRLDAIYARMSLP